MKTAEDLVAEFATAVAAQTDAIWAGDAKTGNKHAKRYIAAFERLCALGDPGRDALAVLFAHERPDVRVSAAAFCCGIEPRRPRPCCGARRGEKG